MTSAWHSTDDNTRVQDEGIFISNLEKLTDLLYKATHFPLKSTKYHSSSSKAPKPSKEGFSGRNAKDTCFEG